MTRPLARQLARGLARQLASGAAGSSGGGVVALAISNTTPTEGDEIVFSMSGSADSVQLYHNGVWVWGGDTLPLTRRVGPQDSGEYTLSVTKGEVTTETEAVSLNVSSADLVADEFNGPVSSDWSTVTGTPSISGGAWSVGTSSLTRNISNDNCRAILQFNNSALNFGQPVLMRLNGEGGNPIVSCQLVTQTQLRIIPGADGWSSGAEYQYNAPTSSFTVITVPSGNHTLEVRWDSTSNSGWVYVDDRLMVAIKNASGSPRRAISIDFGNANNASIGPLTCQYAKAKEGTHIASQSYSALSRIALVTIFGQSNAKGADTASYSAVTDVVPYLFEVNGHNGASSNNWTIAGAPSSTHVGYAFFQNIQLPSNHGPAIQQGAAGGTSFSTGQWAVGGVNRLRCIAASEMLAEVVEEVANLAIILQGFEGDTASGYTATQYKNLLSDFLSELRVAVNDTATPIFIGGFTPAYLEGGEAESANYILFNGYNEDYTEEDVAGGGFASSLIPDPVGYLGDLIHFSGAGLRELGARHAAAYLARNPHATP